MFVDDITFLSFFMFSVPFVIWGMYAFSLWLTGLIKVRRGFYGVRWIEKNHQERESLVRPSGPNEIKIDGKPRPFLNDPDHFILRGSKKIIAFTKLGEKISQLSFKSSSTQDKNAPPEDLFNEMLLEAEQVGKMLSLKPNPLMLILVIAAAGAAIIGLLIGGFNAQQINELPAITSNAIANNSVITGIPGATFEKIAPFLGSNAAAVAGIPAPNASVIP